MERAIEKADTLIEALGWIRAFRGKTTIIKLGGSVLDNPDMLRHILLDILFMETVGMRPVVVHGGGKRINQAMNNAGIEPQFIQGRRVTDERTLAIVRRVLASEINCHLAAEFEKIGGRAMTLNFDSTPVLFGKKIPWYDERGHSVDLGAVGEVTRVDRLVIDNLCYAGQVPFIPSMCVDENGGGVLNVNADTAATTVATQLNADKLVFLSDVPGLLADANDPNTRISSLTASKARQMIEEGKITGGMIPKIQACLDTIGKGVRKVHIVDGRIRHSLLLEIYTTVGVGTLIVKDVA
jgi:acetylglutamate kinase